MVQSVATEIRKKNSGVFEAPVKIGAEQKFISTLLNSHNNNLEEQYLLGVDCLVSAWMDNESQIAYVTKKFFNGDVNSLTSDGYYILFIEDYLHQEVGDYYFRDEGLFLPEYDSSKAYFDFVPSDNAYKLMLDDDNLYSFDIENYLLKIDPIFEFQTLQKKTLCLRKEINNVSDTKINSDILISEKTIQRRVNNEGKLVFKQDIVNFL